MRRARGFTLVELLVALSMLALLAVMSWRGIDGMTRAQAHTEARADEVLALQTGLAQWAADLDGLVQLQQLTAIEWNGRVLRLTRRGTGAPAEGVHVVGWARREGRWLRWESPALVTRGEVEGAWQQADLWAANPSDEHRRLEVGIAPLEQWQIFFYRNDSWTNPQSSDAQVPGPLGMQPASRTAAIPEGVRLVLDLPAGQALAGRLTRDWVNPTVGGGKS